MYIHCDSIINFKEVLIKIKKIEYFYKVYIFQFYLSIHTK